MTTDNTETESDSTVEPPEEDFIPEGNDQPPEPDPEVEQAFQQAKQFHDIMDSAKHWSIDKNANLRVKAATAESDEEREQLEQIADLAKSVGQRVMEGDNNRARQP